VLLDDGDAVVGDLVRAGFAFGRIRPHHPLRHYFAEDVAGVRRGLDFVLDHDPQQLYVGHGGPNVCADHVRRGMIRSRHPADATPVKRHVARDGRVRHRVCEARCRRGWASAMAPWAASRKAAPNRRWFI
jgi:hypothetical protein